MSRPITSAARRPLLAVFARRSLLRSSPQVLLASVGRSLGRTLAVALLALPLALAWGVAHAEVDDYLGPHQVRFASNYSGEVAVDLGPIGRMYLPSRRAPIGLTITVGGVGVARASGTSFFSEATLTQYAGVFNEPEEALAGVVERLSEDVLVETLKAEAVLLGLFALWMLRRQLLAPWLHQSVPLRQAALAYLATVSVIFGSIAAPPRPVEGIRIPVTVNQASPLRGLTVDSVLLATSLDRGVKGIGLLTRRQQKAVDAYIDSAGKRLQAQVLALPRPGPGETMMLGYSDLHCNQAMTTLIGRLVGLTRPALILDSGDDTVNGTAAERFCITRQAEIANGIPIVVSSGNHDSDVTETQMRNAKVFTVLDGKVEDVAGLAVLGDDDPEYNVPFSVERTSDRPESEEQLAQRMLATAQGKEVDVLLVHQPAASVVIMNTPDPPARLVAWGHFHTEEGPAVVWHSDGSWTVGMQQGTAGGVRQPTISSFSTPFSPPLKSADVYFYFRDDATGLITGVQPVHFLPDADVVVAPRLRTGDLDALPLETRVKLAGSVATPTPTGVR